jgi:hypothetical protein
MRGSESLLAPSPRRKIFLDKIVDLFFLMRDNNMKSWNYVRDEAAVALLRGVPVSGTRQDTRRGDSSRNGWFGPVRSSRWSGPIVRPTGGPREGIDQSSNWGSSLACSSLVEFHFLPRKTILFYPFNYTTLSTSVSSLCLFPKIQIFLVQILAFLLHKY